jgi:hypothetical protein
MDKVTKTGENNFFPCVFHIFRVQCITENIYTLKEGIRHAARGHCAFWIERGLR